jgi:large subunit ribosomal protein L11
MARSTKKVLAKVKLQLQAGSATPAPPVGRDLGLHDVNLAEFCKRYNDATRDQNGATVPAVVTIYEDRSFSLMTRTPTTAYLLRQAAVEKGFEAPGRDGVDSITREQLRRVAQGKIPDPNASSVEAA